MDHKNHTEGPAGQDLRELIARAASGSQDAFEELKGRYKPLLESQIAKHSLYDMSAQDVEDLRQEALVSFCNAVCNYNCESEGVEFGLYAKICIENGLVSFVRSFVRRRKTAVLPLESAVKAQGEGSDLLQSLVDRENTAELVRRIRRSLSDYENRVWWMYVSGMSVSKIAEVIGDAEPKSVSNAVYRIRKKLQRFMEERQNNE